MSSPERYIHMTQEWLHATSLFGWRLSAADWPILGTVAHYTWGLQRDSAEIGIAMFEARMPGFARETVRRRVAALSTPRSAAGLGLIRVVEQPTHKRGRVLCLESDWSTWAWETEDELARCALAMTAYGRTSRSVVSDWEPKEEAVTLAVQLRSVCLGLVPEAEVPPINLNQGVWRRWCQSMEKLLEKRAVAQVSGIIRYVERDPFYQGSILGNNADQRLIRNVDSIQARMAASRRKQT